MKAKRILSLLTVVAVMFTLFALPTSAVAGGTFVVNAVDAKAGQDVEVKVNAVIPTAGFNVWLTYPTDKLTYKSSTTMDANTTVEDDGAGKIVIGYTNLSGADVNADAATIIFTACDEAALGDAASVDAELAITYGVTKRGAVDVYDKTGANYDAGVLSFTGKTIAIRKAHLAPVVTAAIAGEAVVGKTLTASATYTDNWNLTGTTTYAWFIDGVEVATGETYVVKAADFGKAITAKATVVVEADENTTGVGEATSAAVAYDAEAKSAATVAIKSAVIAVGAPIEIETTTTKSINDGEVALTYAWTYEDGTALAGNPVNEATYTPVLADYEAGKKIKVTVTPKGANDTLAGDAVSAVAASNTVAGNMKPEIADLAVSKDAPVVGDVLTVSYTFTDIADSSYVGEGSTDASVITWFVGDAEEGVVADEYTVAKEDLGKVIKAVVVAGSTDATPNTNLGLSAEEVVVGNTLEVATSAVAKNPEYKPEVADVAFSAKKLSVGKSYKVSYVYEDLNGIADASTFAIYVADAEDAAAEDWTAIEGFAGDVEDLGVTAFKFTKDQQNKFVKIVVTVKNADGDVNEAVESAIYEVKKASTSSSGLTGPNLTSGSKEPVAPVEPSDEPTDEPTAPSIIEQNKDALVLTINSTEVGVFGEAVANDVAPIIRNDRTMLPARIVAESLGAEVAWDEATKTVTITKGETVIVIVIDSDKATVNGEEVALDSAAFIENDRTYTPVRFIAEALGATVGWDDATKTVTITPAVVADEK